MTEQEELQLKIRDLEKEVARLHSQIKTQRYGLTWLDVPEGFETDSEDKIPILTEVKDKAINCREEACLFSDTKAQPPHILIEGDNYHALTCLNYTHRGKIDVIYIDPPYNTGNDGFTYKDKRFLKEFPDGTPVPVDSPLRHSYWLSFMSKRLELAKNLLSDKGVIFISIDDNEQANLKLLCDKVFGENNFVAILPRVTKKSGKAHSDNIAKNHDYILTYTNSNRYVVFNGIKNDVQKFNNIDEFVEQRGKYKLNQTLDYNSLWYNTAMDFPLNVDGKTFYAGGNEEKYNQRQKGIYDTKDWVWRWSKEKFDFGYKNGFVKIKKSRNGIRIYTKTYLNASIEKINNEYQIIYSDRETKMSSLALCENEYSNDNAKKDITDIIGGNTFDFPKPISLIQTICELCSHKSSTILDFFAGSGTTMHATMKLNAEDGGTRQCILVQQNEGKKHICENVTYERNRRVMCGYTNAKGKQVKGLGGSMKYYKTDFVGKHRPKEATDEDCVVLSQKAGCLLALAENTLEEIETTTSYQLFSNKDNTKFTAVYFTESLTHFEEFVNKIQTLCKTSSSISLSVYIFSWSDGEEFMSNFANLSNVTIKTIPQPILEIYKTLNQ